MDKIYGMGFASSALIGGSLLFGIGLPSSFYTLLLFVLVGIATVASLGGLCFMAYFWLRQQRAENLPFNVVRFPTPDEGEAKACTTLLWAAVLALLLNGFTLGVLKAGASPATFVFEITTLLSIVAVILAGVLRSIYGRNRRGANGEH